MTKPALLTLRIIAALFALSVVTGPLSAQHAAPGQPAAATDYYAPYRFMLGEWEIGPEGNPFMILRFNFGRNESYLWYSAATLQGGTEEIHFEGMLLWNGAQKNLDLLLTLDPQRGRIQEKGTMRAEADGTLVREITGTYSSGMPLMWNGQRAGPEGATMRFRQTYKAISADEIVTAIMRQEGDGWVPSFPGSDHFVLRRKK
jgi:hypothetical protein